MRIADKNRGPKKFPHWHDASEWVKKTTMTRSRFLAMTPAEFADWVFCGYDGDDVKGFFFGIGSPEGHTYCYCPSESIAAYHNLKRHLSGWPTVLIDTDEQLEPWDK